MTDSYQISSNYKLIFLSKSKVLLAGQLMDKLHLQVLIALQFVVSVEELNLT